MENLVLETNNAWLASGSEKKITKGEKLIKNLEDQFTV